jgi:hypothetical protein
MQGESMTPGRKAARTRKRRAAGAKAARTKKRKMAGVKAAVTRKRRAAGAKATVTRKRRTAGVKAAATRRRRTAGVKAARARKPSTLHSRLAKLDAGIAAGRFGHAEPWDEADIIVATTRPPPSDLAGSSPDKDYVVTPFVAELSWLFESLRDAFGEAIDSANQDSFYGRLAAAADRYSDSRAPETQTASDLLGAVVKEAKQMAGEFG